MSIAGGSISLASKSGNNYYFAFNGIETNAAGINRSSSAEFTCKVV